MFKKLINIIRPKLPTLSGRPEKCCFMLGLIAMALITSCALDQETIERKRADIRFLCANPETVVLKELCDRVAPDTAGPVDLLQTE